MTYLGLLAGGMVQIEFPGLFAKINPELFREYQRERFHTGTTDGRWNCGRSYGECVNKKKPRRRAGLKHERKPARS